MTPDKNDWSGQLAGMAVHDVDDWRVQRIQKRAHAVLARNRRLSGLNRAYSRYLEPALVGGLSLVILLWAMERTLYLFS
jgi:hypothetical protein